MTLPHPILSQTLYILSCITSLPYHSSLLLNRPSIISLTISSSSQSFFNMSFRLFVNQPSSLFRLMGASEDVVDHYNHIKSQEKKTFVDRQGRMGRGLFAGEDIKAGEYIVEYVGELVDSAEYQRRFNRYKSLRYKNDYFAHLDGEFHLDATITGNNGRFANHSCTPNAHFVAVQLHLSEHYVLFIEAAKDIKRNHSINVDYSWFKSDTEFIDLDGCNCSSSSCRGYI